MNSFWNNVSTVVQEKTKLDDSQYLDALIENTQLIVEFLSFSLFPEPTEDNEIANTKKEILSLYTTDIAPTVSKIEVYVHDLPPEVVEAIYYLLQCIMGSELAESYEERLSNYKKTLAYTYFVKYLFQKSLATLLFKRIASYKRIVKSFKHRGVLVDKTPFLKKANARIAEAKRAYSFTVKKYKTTFVHRRWKSIEKVDLLHSDSNMNFDNLIDELEHIEELFTSNMPHILGNGYNQKIAFRVFRWALNTVSALFLFYWLLSVLGVWGHLVEFVRIILK